MTYDTAACGGTCETEPEIHLQISSSIRSTTSSPLPKFRPWISLTAGSEYVDISQHPVVIQARFDTTANRLGDLTVRADVVREDFVLGTISLFDTGTMGQLCNMLDNVC